MAGIGDGGGVVGVDELGADVGADGGAAAALGDSALTLGDATLALGDATVARVDSAGLLDVPAS